MDEQVARALIAKHFANAGKDEVAVAEIYAEDAILEFPQGRERIRGKANILAFRSAYPASLEFEMRRTIGSGNLWVNEYTIRYDGKPSHAVGIMEFSNGLVIRETVYVSEPWEPPAWRAQWVEPMEPEAPVEGQPS
jgi:SnoaL-like domain